eukprot:IDg11710t1
MRAISRRRRAFPTPLLKKVIDMECYSWSVAPASRTPMINAGMVFADRHYGGVRYPVGGVGALARALADGIAGKDGCWVRCGTRVSRILFDKDGAACGVRLASGATIRARAVVSNATRWDTFTGGDRALVPPEHVPATEARFRSRYEKSASSCLSISGCARTGCAPTCASWTATTSSSTTGTSSRRRATQRARCSCRSPPRSTQRWR